jgi:hypothetical protein
MSLLHANPYKCTNVLSILQPPSQSHQAQSHLSCSPQRFKRIRLLIIGSIYYPGTNER